MRAAHLLAAGPTPRAYLLHLPTHPAVASPIEAAPDALLSGSDDGEVVLEDVTCAAIARRDGGGGGEHGSRQHSENGDLHGSGRSRVSGGCWNGTKHNTGLKGRRR